MPETNENIRAEDASATALPAAPKLWKLMRDLIVLGCIYLVVILVAAGSVGLCGPNCGFVFYVIMAGASGVLMLSKRLVWRCICLAVLLASIYGMWNEKNMRDSWRTHALQEQLERLQHTPVNISPP